MITNKSKEMNFWPSLVPRIGSSLRGELQRNLQVQINEPQTSPGNNLLPPHAGIESFSQIPQNISTAHNVYNGDYRRRFRTIEAQPSLSNKYAHSSSIPSPTLYVNPDLLRNVEHIHRQNQRNYRHGGHSRCWKRRITNTGTQLPFDPNLHKKLEPEKFYQQKRPAHESLAQSPPYIPTYHNFLNEGSRSCVKEPKCNG